MTIAVAHVQRIRLRTPGVVIHTRWIAHCGINSRWPPRASTASTRHRLFAAAPLAGLRLWRSSPTSRGRCWYCSQSWSSGARVAKSRCPPLPWSRQPRRSPHLSHCGEPSASLVGAPRAHLRPWCRRSCSLRSGSLAHPLKTGSPEDRVEPNENVSEHFPEYYGIVDHGSPTARCKHGGRMKPTNRSHFSLGTNCGLLLTIPPCPAPPSTLFHSYHRSAQATYYGPLQLEHCTLQ